MRKPAILIAAIMAIVAMIWWRVPSILTSKAGSAGSEASGLPFSIGDVKINPFGGTVSLTDIQLHSVAPFLSPQVLRIAKIEATFQTSTLLSDHVVVNQVLIAGTELTVEQSGISLNVSSVLDRLNHYAAASDTSQGPRVFIHELRFEAGRGTIITDVGSREFAVAPITLTNLGSETDGTPIATLAVSILEPILAETLSNAGIPFSGNASIGSRGLGRLRDLIGR